MNEAGQMPPDERLARVMLASASVPGETVTARLVRTFGATETVRLALSDGGGAAASEMGRWHERVGSSLDADRARTLLEETDAAGARLLIPGDPGWPTGMDILGDQEPLALWVKGDMAALSAPSVGILGMRAATAYGAHMATELGREAAEQGLTVVSTGSYGIAAAAHRAALLSGGKTVAVLPSGIDRLYPAGNTELLEQIAQVGALVTESPPGSAPTQSQFVQRGRLIAALSSAVVVVEAGARSGALVHAAQAAEFGLPVGAVPGPVTSAASAGSNRLIGDEIAGLVTGIDDVAALVLRDGNHLPRLVQRQTHSPTFSYSWHERGHKL